MAAGDALSAAAAARAKEAEDEPWKQFTPRQVTISHCLARTWNAGLGGQCPRSPAPGLPYCAMHAGDKWKVHGNVKGPIPAKKLLEFQKANASRQKPADAGAARSSSSKAPAPAAGAPPAAAAQRSRPPDPAEVARASEKRIRQTTKGIISREELLSAEQPALLKIVQGKGWKGASIDSMCESLQKETLAGEKLEKIQEKIWKLQDADVMDLVRLDILAQKNASLPGMQPARGEKRKADGAPAAAPAAARLKVAGGAQEIRSRAQGPGPGLQPTAAQASRQAAPPPAPRPARSADKEKAKQCTCHCPIHQPRCPLWKGMYEPQRDVKFVHGVASGRPQTPGQSAAPPPRGPRTPTLSASAAERVAHIDSEVRQLPRSQQRAELRKRMLLYHPDKRQGQAAGDASVATEIFMELKRRSDNLPP